MAAGPNRRCASPLPGCLGATGSPLAAAPLPTRNAPLDVADAPVPRCDYAEDVFRRFEETFRRLFDHVPSGIYEATADGRVVLANAWFARLLGYAAPGDLEGIPLAALDVDPDRRAAFLDALNSHGDVNNAEHQLRRTDGTAVTVLESAFLVRGEDGRILHIQGTLTDITARKELEAQVRQTQKLEALGQLAGGVAHDFNNLLTAILGQTELLMDDVPTESVAARSLREIQKAAQSAARLTAQLLAFSRRQIVQPIVIDVNVEIERLTEMLRRLLGERVELQIDAGPSTRIKVDRGLLEQVLLNLAVNARDAMPDGGTIVIAARVVQSREARLLDRFTIPAGTYSVITVSDTGVGMDAATQTRIFEPFFTTKGDAGTGLGLATVYGLIKQHHGFITVTSAPGCGTTFEIRLPCVGAETACVTEPPSARSHRARGGDCVLVVEDDELVRQLVSRALRAHGYTVFEAGDAENAMGLSRADLISCHLLVSDVVLPRMDGRALAEEMRRINPGIAVLLMSGYMHMPIGSDAHFLSKPFTPNDLLIKVGDALRSVGPCAP